MLERNRDLDLLFDHAPIGYVLLDEKYFITNANLQAFAILGLSKSRLRHEHFYNYLAPGEVKRFLDWMMDYSKHPGVLRVPLRCREGERYVQLDLHFHEDEKGRYKRPFSLSGIVQSFIAQPMSATVTCKWWMNT